LTLEKENQNMQLQILKSLRCSKQTQQKNNVVFKIAKLQVYRHSAIISAILPKQTGIFYGTS
jgi:hypothetical protein